ncbi:cell division protein ZapA [Acetobacteraceae bacterium]|nr:cell division protein ZapA [Acetobacteraceae bacterium]
MAIKKDLLVNGSLYTVWCKEEDEEKIKELGANLEDRNLKVARALRPDSESHGWFLTSLLLLSELEEKLKHERTSEGKSQQELQEKIDLVEVQKKEIHALELSLATARHQVALLADRAEKVLFEAKKEGEKMQDNS